MSTPGPDIVELIESACAGALDDAGHADLGDRLAADPVALRRYVRTMLLSVALSWELGTRVAAPAVRSKPDLSPSRAKLRVPRLALAAALLLAACGVAIYAVSVNRPSAVVDPQPTTASVLDVSDTATLMIDNRIASAGEAYAGREVSLDAGEAEFMLPNEVGVRLRGATRMTIHDAMNVTMSSGTAEFVCPPRAKGYTVFLPDRSRVVDLGTAFHVAVGDDGQTSVYVIEGKVAWTGAAENAEPVVVAAGRSARLIDGRPVVLDDRIILAHDFNGGGGDLNGTAPDVRPHGEKWVAARSLSHAGFRANGRFGGGDATPANSGGSATLAFTPASGTIYQLDASLLGVSGDGDWIALGFARGQSSQAHDSARFTNGQVVGRAWMMVRGDQATTPNRTFLDGTNETEAWLDGPGQGGDVDLRIVLDTTGGPGRWTAAFYAKRPADESHTLVRGATPLAEHDITSVGFAVAGAGVAGSITRFSLAELHAGVADHDSEHPASETADR